MAKTPARKHHPSGAKKPGRKQHAPPTAAFDDTKRADPILTLEPPGTSAGPDYAPVPDTASVIQPGPDTDVDAPWPAQSVDPDTGAVSYVASNGNTGVMTPALSSLTGGGFFATFGANNMKQWIIPAVVFIAAWYFTGGIGWAVVAAIAAWFLMRWMGSKATTPANAPTS